MQKSNYLNSNIDPIDDNVPRSYANHLRKHLKLLVKQKNNTDLDFCEKIFYSKVVYVSGKECIPFFQYCGFNSWKEYVEQELEITISKAHRYAAIYSKYFVELSDVFTEQHYIDIDKLELLMPIIDSSNLNTLINKARQASYESLKELLSPSKKNYHKIISFKVTEGESKIIEKALIKAKLYFGDGLLDNKLFVEILKDWEKNVE